MKYIINISIRDPRQVSDGLSLVKIKCNIKKSNNLSTPSKLAATSKVKGLMVVPVGFVCAQNLLDSAVDFLPVRRTGSTGPERTTQTTAKKTLNSVRKILKAT